MSRSVEETGRLLKPIRQPSGSGVPRSIEEAGRLAGERELKPGSQYASQTQSSQSVVR